MVAGPVAEQRAVAEPFRPVAGQQQQRPPMLRGQSDQTRLIPVSGALDSVTGSTVLFQRLHWLILDGTEWIQRSDNWVHSLMEPAVEQSVQPLLQPESGTLSIPGTGFLSSDVRMEEWEALSEELAGDFPMHSDPMHH